VHAASEEKLLLPPPVEVAAGLHREEVTGEEPEDAIDDQNEVRDAMANVGEYPTGSIDQLRDLAELNQINES
jgi:glutamate/tyrosine decarboxylase-like PLP-dependent enzyme